MENRVEVLDIVCQDRSVKVRDLLGSGAFTYARNEVEEDVSEGQFAEFEL